MRPSSVRPLSHLSRDARAYLSRDVRARRHLVNAKSIGLPSEPTFAVSVVLVWSPHFAARVSWAGDMMGGVSSSADTSEPSGMMRLLIVTRY